MLKWRMWLGIVIPAVMAGVGSIAYEELFDAPMSTSIAANVVYLGLMLAAMFVSGRVCVRIIRPIFREELPRVGFCGTCAYDLRQVEPDGEEILCPECGAANPLATPDRDKP